MKTIRNWHDLETYGIRCLTGEACLLSARALCDLTDDGQALVREFFGLPYSSTFQDSWNSRATASCFLPWSILPELSAFCLLTRGGCHNAVQIRGDGVYGIEEADSEEQLATWLKFQGNDVQRVFKPLPHPGSGLSAQHAASGRVQ
jgi:hypothetical protein